MGDNRSLKIEDAKTRAEVKALLDDRAELYEQPGFIDDDPICIPHSFSKKEDAEIGGFLSATIAWGQRKTIVNNARAMMERMDQAPHDFVLNASGEDLRKLEGFVHRTFNDTDLLYFIEALGMVYRDKGGLETVFADAFAAGGGAASAIHRFRDVFFSIEHPQRTGKHVADPLRGSTAKRINMFLRWMVRPADKGVDLGLWSAIAPAQLILPLDVHTGNVARKLRLLRRKQNDWKSVEEVMKVLRRFDADDPVKYDFALFGLGMYES
jgi:uncharacterized protein (TIGR02757 family)